MTTAFVASLQTSCSLSAMTFVPNFSLLAPSSLHPDLAQRVHLVDGVCDRGEIRVGGPPQALVSPYYLVMWT